MTTHAFPTLLVERLRDAKRVAVLTGAGISAESGVPTFREAQTGLWAQYDPQQLATPGAFRRDPRLVWDWYQWRRELVSAARPNPGHVALVAMEQQVPQFTLITQNVDGLHAQAGSRAIIELHGDLARVKCFDNDHPATTWDTVDEPPPRCLICGSLLRPDVVWFGENLPHAALQDALRRTKEAEVFLTIGTSGLVHPAASMPLLAAETGALTVEINPVETELSLFMDYQLRGPAGEILPQLVAAVWG
jgi:NAD-dependent deacetylase